MAFCTRETFAKSTRKHKINMRTSRSTIANSRSFTLRIESKLGFVHKRQWSTGDSPLSFALLQMRQRCCVVSRKCRFSELPTVLQIRRFSSTCAHCDTVRVVRIVSFEVSELIVDDSGRFCVRVIRQQNPREPLYRCAVPGKFGEIRRYGKVRSPANARSAKTTRFIMKAESSWTRVSIDRFHTDRPLAQRMRVFICEYCYVPSLV